MKKNTLFTCSIRAVKSFPLPLVLLMAISLSTAVALTRTSTSASLLNHSSTHRLRSRSRKKTIIDPIMQSETSIGLSFCVEAISESSSPHVKIKQIEEQNNMLGFDVKSAREWMEHIEQSEGECHGVGAYTVLRCDAIYSKNNCRWKIWGLDFHMHRVCSSFRALIKNMSPKPFDNYYGVDWEHDSMRRSNDVIIAILNDAEMSLMNIDTDVESHDINLEVDVGVRTLMLTILWTPAKTHDKMQIIRGHATFAGSSRVWNPNGESLPVPISVCLAIPSNPTSEALSLLPRRHLDSERLQVAPAQSVGPNAKVSSWCRYRRPLESLFKDSGVGEVLLMGERQNTAYIGGQRFIDSLEMLEGLISNLFVIYKDGTVRTAPTTKVLSGYARHLVLEEINQTHGLSLDDMNAPVVGDADDWAEVFLTSAIRLIIPVKRVLIPVEGTDSVTLWESPDRGSDDFSFTRIVWAGIHKRMK